MNKPRVGDVVQVQHKTHQNESGVAKLKPAHKFLTTKIVRVYGSGRIAVPSGDVWRVVKNKKGPGWITSSKS